MTLSLDECRKLKGGARVLIAWADGWQDREATYTCNWRGGLLWAINEHGVSERVICWRADAKPAEILKHKVRLCPAFTLATSSTDAPPGDLA